MSLTEEENNSEIDMAKILLCSTQLAANYNLWENNTNIQDTLDMEKNDMCQFMKKAHPYLDDLSIKCVVLSFYLNFYKKITETISL